MAGMTLHKVFYADDVRLRYVWSLLAFLVFAAVGVMLLPRLPVPHKLGNEILAAWLLAVSLLAWRMIDRRPAGMLGLNWHAFSARQCWGGILLGGSMVSAVIVASAAFGWVEIEGHAMTAPAIFEILGTQFITFLAAATIEELIFRGYPYQLAIDRSSVTIATFAFTVAFGLAHMMNPNAAVLPVINTVLAGLWLTAAYVRTRQLWLPIAMHTSWNLVQGTVWGTEVSGNASHARLLTTHMTGPAWVTGGAYGPEGGVICTVVVLLGIGVVYALPLFRMSPEQFALMHRVRYAEDRALLERDGHA